MTERELIDHRPAGARIYNDAGSAGRDEDEPRYDPTLTNNLTIIIVAALILGFVFGLVLLSSVF